ncbi:TetR/AcrR family transcriptional regulator [Sporosarcina sp. FSL K6-3457]|uniref:TetR/AcrR family transcriptional regulator n=1 Tax=Sporosarcina sp. FSL K6-3457 TaxID=2978204 RepID=UPI0030F99C19
MSSHKSTSQELTKEMIVQQARTLFVEKGFHDVSMRSIAKQVGCTHGALYYHFKNKVELFNAIVKVDFTELNILLEDTVQGPGEDVVKLKNVFLCFIQFGLNNQSQYEFMFVARYAEVDSLSQEAAFLSYQKFAESVQALSSSRLAVKDVWSAFLALHGFVVHHRGFVKNFKEAKVSAESHVEFILKGLCN